MLALGDSSIQSSGTDSDSVPLLTSKLAAKLKSIDGLVSLSLAATLGVIQLVYDQNGEMGTNSKPSKPSSKPLLLSRRSGSGKGGSSPLSK